MDKSRDATSRDVINQLKDKLGSLEQRVGYILPDDEVVEVHNVARMPRMQFMAYEWPDPVRACWHTHPQGSRNLSMDDWASFRANPEMDHYIIGMDGISHYRVVDDNVVTVAQYL
jgi:proteasome lid subunit RPN8/RPN11